MLKPHCHDPGKGSWGVEDAEKQWPVVQHQQSASKVMLHMHCVLQKSLGVQMHGKRGYNTTVTMCID
jgi:hypothetical protein